MHATLFITLCHSNNLIEVDFITIIPFTGIDAIAVTLPSTSIYSLSLSLNERIESLRVNTSRLALETIHTHFSLTTTTTTNTQSPEPE